MATGEHRPKTAHDVWAVAGILLLGLVALSPWAYGCVTPAALLALSLGIFTLALLWAANSLLTKRFSYTPDVVSCCLLGLVLLAAAQLVPLPVAVARILSPAAVEWHRTLVPEALEVLPDETQPEPPSRWVKLSAAPAATEELLAALVAVFLVYTAARNFVAFADPKESLRQLAWVAFAVGMLLALLGLLQGFSKDRTNNLWTSSEGKPFGPFVNKNHFAFQMNLFLGLAAGLFVSVMQRRRGWRSPLAMGLLGGLGVMVTALAFSESRGGVLAAIASAVFVGVVAWLREREQKTKSETKAGLVLGIGIVVVAGLMTAWIGVSTVVDRMGTLFGDKADNRTADWRSVWPLVERFPLTGVGGGALIWAEPTVRTRSDITYVFNTMDNEYLEALVEGGFPRFLLTLGLGVAAVWVAVRGYRRTGDPLLLGCAFGLTAIAIHSAGDFGLHTGSVAISAAVVAAFATARGREPTSRAKNREGRVDRGEWVFTGGSVSAIAALLVLAALAVVLTEWRVYRGAKFREVAALLLRAGSPRQRDDAIRVLETATRIRPNDPAAWELLMGAHVLAASDRQRALTASVVGGAVMADPVEIVPFGDPDGHVSAALRAARRLRECQRLSPAAHIALGTFAEVFVKSEPSAAHFAKAKRLTAFDPDVWYFSGRAAANRGDWSAAASDWRESLLRSQKRLKPIVWQAKTRFAPAELRANVFPDDPEVWFAATPDLFPIADESRQAWLRGAADRWAAGAEPTVISGFVNWATTLELLGEHAAATRVWQRAVERFPEEIVPRDRLAAALFTEELYEDAVPVLEWLLAKRSEDAGFRERLAAAKHALKLKADINRD